MFTDETGLTVLIADDEEATREGLRSLLPWETLGVTEVVVASDGMEALDIISQRRPDVIISDIRMPRLDGISLARAAVTGGECALIFISGYSDKEFLKSAIELRAGRPVERFSQLPESALSAEDALALRFYRGRNGCSFWNETPDAPQNAGYAAGFLSALAEKNGPEALRALEALEKRVGALCLSGRYPNIPELQGSCVDIADGIFEAAGRAGISHEKLGPPPEAEASFSETLCALRGLAGRFFDEYQYAERSRPALTIMRCIDANFADSGFGISDVAKEVHLTISHICHIFKNETGMTVNEYLTRTRLRQAALLLAGDSVRVADVAEKVGYSDPNYFARLFKRQYGVTPSEFRSGSRRTGGAPA